MFSQGKTNHLKEGQPPFQRSTSQFRISGYRDGDSSTDSKAHVSHPFINTLNNNCSKIVLGSCWPKLSDSTFASPFNRVSYFVVNEVNRQALVVRMYPMIIEIIQRYSQISLSRIFLNTRSLTTSSCNYSFHNFTRKGKMILSFREKYE